MTYPPDPRCPPTPYVIDVPSRDVDARIVGAIILVAAEYPGPRPLVLACTTPTSRRTVTTPQHVDPDAPGFTAAIARLRHVYAR